MMAATKEYARINWESYPSTNTPLSASNLNKMDEGINKLDNSMVNIKNRMGTAEGDIDDIQGELVTLDSDVSTLQGNLTSDNVSFRFAIDGEGNYGYLKADDSFIPFKSYKFTENDVTPTTAGVEIFDLDGLEGVVYIDITPKEHATSGFEVCRATYNEEDKLTQLGERISGSGSTKYDCLSIKDGKIMFTAYSNTYNKVHVVRILVA